MPIGGKLVLKGGVTLGKKKKKKKPAVDEALAAELEAADADTHQEHDPSKPKPLAPTAISVTGKTYEEEFIYETQRTQAPKVRSTPWGSSYRAPPTLLHGYSKAVSGNTAQERLDLRCASKADKFCK